MGNPLGNLFDCMVSLNLSHEYQLSWLTSLVNSYSPKVEIADLNGIQIGFVPELFLYMFEYYKTKVNSGFEDKTNYMGY